MLQTGLFLRRWPMKSAPRSNLFLVIEGEVSKVNWKRIVFWAALWWCICSAPTEDPFAKFREERDPLATEYTPHHVIHGRR